MMQRILLATAAAMAMFGATESQPDYRVDIERYLPPPAELDSPEGQSWRRAAELSLRAHRLQQKTDRAWLRARIAWSRYETQRDFGKLSGDDDQQGHRSQDPEADQR